MRYKFRGKRIDNEEWVHFNFYGAYVDENGIEISPKRFIRDCGFKVAPETVGQQIIFKDQEFYEGDMLKVSIFSHNTGKLIVEQTVPIEYRNCKFGVMFGSDFTCLDGFSNTTFEVVGTLYDGEAKA